MAAAIRQPQMQSAWARQNVAARYAAKVTLVE